jgi:hypothetical protein
MQLADDKLGVNCERNFEKIVFVSGNRLVIQEQNYIFRHFMPNPPPFVMCQPQDENGDFVKTAG